MIICITGLPAAGKSSVAQVLKLKGFKVYELGDIVREMMKDAGIRLTAESDNRFNVYIKRKYGKLVVIQRFLKKIKLSRKSNTVIAGFRSKAELDYARKRFPIITIAVVAPARLRFERIMERGRADAPRNFAEFIRDRDNREARFGLIGAIKSADYIISGAGTLAELRREVVETLSSIG